jgi:hypothetical protein
VSRRANSRADTRGFTAKALKNAKGQGNLDHALTRYEGPRSPKSVSRSLAFSGALAVHLEKMWWMVNRAQHAYDDPRIYGCFT